MDWSAGQHLHQAIALRPLPTTDSDKSQVVLVEPDCHPVIDRMLRGSGMALRLAKLPIDAPEAAHPQVDLLAWAMLFEDEKKSARMRAILARKGSADP
jgi:hypothetical protein